MTVKNMLQEIHDGLLLKKVGGAITIESRDGGDLGAIRFLKAYKTVLEEQRR